MFAWIIDLVLRLAVIAVIARVVIQLVGVSADQGVGKIIHDITEPMLRPFRDRVDVRGVRLDFSPVIAIVVLLLLRWVLVRVANG